MPIDASRISGLAKRALREAQSRATRPTAHRSPYRQWAGPALHVAQSGPQISVATTSISDIVLIQGIAPVSAALSLEVGDGERAKASFEITHRFPHPDAPATHANHPYAFETTLDADQARGASHFRVLCDEQATPWHQLQIGDEPSGMTGVELLESCPACDGQRFAATGRRGQLDMATCLDCGLVMTNPRPVEDHTLLRYSERYFEDEYLPALEASSALDAHLDSLLDRVEHARPYGDELFELGVGGGDLLDRARQRGWRVAGTDVNPAAVQHAVERGLRVWQENVDHANDLGGTYGAVISEMSLEHIRHPDRFCRIAADALVPGGVLLIYTVSAEGSSFAHAGMGSPLVGPAEHLFLFSANALVTLCSRAGLRVDKLWRSPSGDEIGVIATKRDDTGNPAIPYN